MKNQELSSKKLQNISILLVFFVVRLKLFQQLNRIQKQSLNLPKQLSQNYFHLINLVQNLFNSYVQLKINPRQRIDLEQLRQHQWLINVRDSKGRLPYHIKRTQTITQASQIYRMLGMSFFQRKFKEIEPKNQKDFVMPQSWFCRIQKNKKIQLNENRPIIKELSYEMGLNDEAVSDQNTSIFQPFI